MKHMKRISVVQRADAYNDFLNDVWRAWQNFRWEKKNSF
jgi:hypothetical protein